MKSCSGLPPIAESKHELGISYALCCKERWKFAMEYKMERNNEGVVGKLVQPGSAKIVITVQILSYTKHREFRMVSYSKAHMIFPVHTWIRLWKASHCNLSS
jgi:predicted nucleic acid-binding protein